MGGTLRKSSGVSSRPEEPLVDENSVLPLGTELTAQQQQSLAFEQAELANAKLKEKRRTATEKSPKGGSMGSANELGSPASKQKSSSNNREKRGSETSGTAKSPRGEMKWNKPVAAVVAAALGEEETEVETIDIDHSFAQQNTARSDRRASNSNHQSNHSNSSLSPTNQPVMNPWSKPSLFVRNFQNESADAEMLVQLSRDRAHDLEKQNRKAAKKSKSTIVQEQQQQPQVSPPSETRKQRTLEEDDEFQDDF